ncbi:unnamed protein product [Leptosia nina]|uniref:Uncharacterized protein n=1 Tax=Leptosia nina TaxID=320188 RepID=A0AAV1J5U2_9NEOP
MDVVEKNDNEEGECWKSPVSWRESVAKYSCVRDACYSACAVTRCGGSLGQWAGDCFVENKKREKKSFIICR